MRSFPLCWSDVERDAGKVHGRGAHRKPALAVERRRTHDPRPVLRRTPGGTVFRRAERDDIRTLAELWSRAFPGERTIEQRIRQLEMGGVFGGIDAVWMAHIDGRLAGAFRAYSLTQHVHGTTYPLMGLAAVAVDETARRRGVGRALCLEAIRIARERGDVLSALYPFRPRDLVADARQRLL
jgi:GNAT superfamily N-acetyltransferase